ncbi:MAG: PAAR domain-containing protein, partial [Bacteroidota bacterium]
MIAAKHFDIVMGVDVHIIMIPTPGGPVPTPIPHPFVGMMFDPNDYDMKAMAMSAASSMGLDLTPVLEIKAVIDGINKEMDKFNPAKRINQLIEDAKSFVKEQLGINPPPSGPAHVNVNGLPRSIITSKGIAAPPHIPIGGPFQKPPDNECEAFLGSLTVRADQEHMCFLGCMTQSCQDIPPFPNSVIMAIPGGP